MVHHKLLRPQRTSAPSAIQFMGIVNVTPDSFSDGGKFNTTRLAVQHGLQLVKEGATVLDIGGESSRPGAEPVTLTEELKRVIPVIQGLYKKTKTSLSIDTYKPEVAEQALQAGASWLNDITGLRNPAMRTIAAKAKCTVVIMHMLGEPQTMQKQPRYRNVVTDIKTFFKQQIKLALAAGIKPNKIILDPGIGFGKTIEHNLTILRELKQFQSLGFPILIGASRKSFIGKLTGADTADRLPGTLAAHAVAVANGASWLRVHDVAAHKQFLQQYSALNRHLAR